MIIFQLTTTGSDEDNEFNKMHSELSQLPAFELTLTPTIPIISDSQLLST